VSNDESNDDWVSDSVDDEAGRGDEDADHENQSHST